MSETAAFDRSSYSAGEGVEHTFQHHHSYDSPPKGPFV
jgi:hypothetical protein